MRYIVYNKVGGTLLVLSGFAIWLIASHLIPGSSAWYFGATYGIAGSAFFLVGCFLPEHQAKRLLLGRRSALELMAFFFWLAGGSIIRLNLFEELQYSAAWFAAALMIIPAFGSYFIATYLIRGFRAPAESPSPDSHKNRQAEQVGGGQPATRPVSK